MKKLTFYWYTFADGYSECSSMMSKNELAHKILKHGKLISRVFECIA